MTRYFFILLCLITLAISASADERPNIILFIADDMAWNDCGAYGHPHIKTPHLDQLAKDGLRVDNAMLTCSSCSPSRASIITGRYPHNTGAHQLHIPLPGEQITFVEKLKESGYYTASAGKWHLGNETVPKFDSVNTKQFEWVKTVKERPRDKPFFFWFAFVDPHRPYQEDTIPEPHTADTAVVPPFLPDNSETREDLAMYYDEITRLDGVVGAVQEELKNQQVAENTLILFISDNGRPFPRCKTTVYDSGVKTPWIVKWPGKIPAGSTSDAIMSSVDIAATFLDVAGLSVGENFMGKSCLPVFLKPELPFRKYAFSEHNWHDFEDFSRGIRSSRYRLVRNYYSDVPLTPPADAVRSPTYIKMIELHAAGKLPKSQSICFEAPRREWEFYDLDSDPFEMNNMIDDPNYEKPVNKLKAALARWQKETNDVLPDERRADGFDRVTGERLKTKKQK
ncbi:MAG: sulfatase [Planctomycetaceae bacterium]|nr:sulfatase [Planctomycetaceae bacterium]